jgi:hypothetical protein
MAISLGADTEKAVRKFAEQKKVEPRDALERLVGTALRRLAAVEKYAKAAAGKAPKAKAKAKKAA